MRPEHKAEMKARKRNIRLTVAYDGTGYHGFQRQTPPVTAVQNVLERVLGQIFGDTIELAAAGRTDAGVHAYGQVVNFFTDGTIPIERVPQAVNGLLPPDIVVIDAAEVPRDFSALHSTLRKTYLYRILPGERPDPFRRNYAWHIRASLDAAAMNEAARFLLGRHDFSAFRASGGAPMSPIRTMDTASVNRKDDEIALVFQADGFLYHMVRNIVGTLALVGRGTMSPKDFSDVLSSGDRHRAGATAPSCGLYLTSVEY